MHSLKIFYILIITLSGTASLQASEVTIPNSFSAGNTAVAADVNENFTAVSTALNDNNSRVVILENLISDQQALITDLQTRLAALEGNNVQSLNGHVELLEFLNAPPVIRFSGVNLQIVNGIGGGVNGMGNLVVGYNDPPGISRGAFCSDGQFDNQGDCESNGRTWSNSQRTGSHNLITGSGNSYTTQGGVVFGFENVINADFYATVTGGSGNVASGQSSSISGGFRNLSTGLNSSISGGRTNIASGDNSSVSGGEGNNASGRGSSLSGGLINFATADFSSVSGGSFNSANGDNSNVSGGTNRTASGINDWVAGSLFEDN